MKERSTSLKKGDQVIIRQHNSEGKIHRKIVFTEMETSGTLTVKENE